MSLTNVIASFLETTLDREPGSIPETMGVSAAASLFGVSASAVQHAIKTGKLPSTPILGADGGVVAHQIELLHAFGIWGHKITTQPKPVKGRDTSERRDTEDTASV